MTPRLIVMCGVPGVGKSTLAEHVATELDAIHYRTDAIRNEIMETPTYSPEASNRIHDELFHRALRDLQEGQTVVVDATFSSRARRTQAETIAQRAGADITFVHVTCDSDVVEGRIETREDDASDADYEVHLRVKQNFESFDRDHITIDNSGSLAAAERSLIAQL